MTVDLKQKWALGFSDRGLGRGDYGIIEELPEGNDEDLGVPTTLVIERLDRELAEHIIELHNQALERTNEIESEVRR